MEHKSGSLSSSRESAFTSPISVTKPVILAGGAVLSSPKEVSEDKAEQSFLNFPVPIYLLRDVQCDMYTSGSISFVAVLSSESFFPSMIPCSIQR